MKEEKRKPWFKFYPSDWRADPRLRMCSLAARGLWADMIAYMHEGVPYGHLTIDGVAPGVGDIASLVARPVAETRKALSELEAKKVFSRTVEGVIFSRRMVRDKAKADKDAENGRGGGNPQLIGEDKPGVNPPDKAHIPEARIQKEQPALSEQEPRGAREDQDAVNACKEIVRIFSQAGYGDKIPDTRRVYVWKAQGWDLKLCVEVVREGVRPGKTIVTLAFFDERIREAHEKRNPAPAVKPEILWDTIAAAYARGKALGDPFWPPRQGPSPGESGCRCPPEILRKHGVNPETGNLETAAA